MKMNNNKKQFIINHGPKFHIIPLVIIMILSTMYLLYLPEKYFKKNDKTIGNTTMREPYELGSVAYEAAFANKLECIEKYQCVVNGISKVEQRSFEKYSCAVNLSRECSKVMTGFWMNQVEDIFDTCWKTIEVYDIEVAFVAYGTVSTFTISLCKAFNPQTMTYVHCFYEKGSYKLFMFDVGTNYPGGLFWLEARDKEGKKINSAEDYAKSIKLMEEYYGDMFDYKNGYFEINSQYGQGTVGALVCPFSTNGMAGDALETILQKLEAMSIEY